MWWWHNGKEVKSNLSPCGSKVWVQLLTSSRAGFGVSPIRPWAWATLLHRATTKRKNIYILVNIIFVFGFTSRVLRLREI